MVNNGKISYMNTDQAGMGSFTLRTTNTFVNNGTVVYGYGGNPAGGADALTWQSMFVNNGLLSLINTNTRPTGMGGTVRLTVTGRAGHAFTNADNGTIRFFSNPASVSNATMTMQLTHGDLVNLGTITSDARKDVTNVLTLVASGATFSNAVGGQVIVVNSNFVIRADNIINLGTNIVHGGGLLLYQNGTGGSGVLTNRGLILLNGGTLRVNELASSGSLAINNGTLSTPGGLNLLSGGLLNGNGTVVGNTTVAGTVAPGFSIGTFTFSNNLTLSGTYAAELDGTGSGSADLLDVLGTLDISGATLDLTSVGTIDDPAYIIAQYGTLIGTFGTVNGMPSGYLLDYNYGSLNQIAVVIPEPSALALAGLGTLFSVLLLRRRR